MLANLTIPERFDKSVHIIVAKSDRNLTALDRKVFNNLMANAYSSLQKRQIHKIRIADISAMLLGDGGSDETVRNSLDRLFEQNISIEYVDEEGIHHTQRCHYLSWKLSDMSTPQLTYAFDPMLLQFLVDPKIYATVKVDISRRLKSVQSIKLYELTQMIRFQFNASKEMTLEEVRQYLEVGDKYEERFNHLKSRVIEPAVQEVSSIADFTVGVEYIKSGRGGKIDGIVFRVIPKISGTNPDSAPTGRKSGKLDDKQIELFSGSTAAERSMPPEVSEQTLRTAQSILGPDGDIQAMLSEWFSEVGERTHLKPDESFLSYVHIKAASNTDEFLEQDVDVEALFDQMMKGST
jgi:hypothetical protein